MGENQKYIIHMASDFGFLELIDVPKLIASCKEKWYNQTLCKVNDSLIRLGVFNEGEFHWHKHDKEDEFSLSLKGNCLLNLKTRR